MGRVVHWLRVDFSPGCGRHFRASAFGLVFGRCWAVATMRVMTRVWREQVVSMGLISWLKSWIILEQTLELPCVLRWRARE